MLDQVAGEGASRVMEMQTMNFEWHSLPVERVAEQLVTSLEHGLDADLAVTSLQVAGPNELVSPLNCPAWLCCLLPWLKHTDAMTKFKACVAESAKVRRSGRDMCIDASCVVPGDLVSLAKGEIVPADCRIISCSEDFCTALFGNHRALRYGVSVPSQLGEPVFDAKCMMLAGSRVVSGNARAIVCLTGKDCALSLLISKNFWPASTTPTGLNDGSGSPSAVVHNNSSSSPQVDPEQQSLIYA